MTVAWGDDAYEQCTVPFGLSNALAVAGGDAHSLALLNDGTVRGWGNNYYGQISIPTNVLGATMIAAGWFHSLALLTNGTVAAWGLNGASLGYHLTEVPADLTNAAVISAQALHTLALRSNGTVVAWGYNQSGVTNVSAGLSNVTAIAAGYQHNLAAKSDGTVVAWGYNGYGQCNVPNGLSNVLDVAAGVAHSLALKNDGTLIAWGDNTFGETNVPSGLSNVVAIAAEGDPQSDSSYSLAIKTNNTVVAWGDGPIVNPLSGLSNVIAIAGGPNHGLAIRSGPRTPVITRLPTDQYQVPGGNVTFAARGAGLYGVAYQWKTNGVNLAGATNATLTLTNVQAAQAADYTVTVTNTVGSASASWQVAMTYVGSYVDVGTLAYYLATNAVGHANGYGPSNTVELSGWTFGYYYSTNLALLTNSVWSTNFWLKGVQGLSATSIGNSNGLGGLQLVTMVSPRHYLYATHVGSAETIAFLDTNNSVYWRTTLQRVELAETNSDTSVGFLDSDLPSSVGYLPVVPTNLLSYLPTNSSGVVQGIGMNQEMRVFSQPMTFGIH